MKRFYCGFVLAAFAGVAVAATLKVDVNQLDADGIKASVGTVEIEETSYGLLFRPDLKGLPAGLHGFHVHEKPACGATANPQGQKVAGLEAGGHYDPQGSKRHEGPYGKGHLGDLPALVVTADGVANYSVLAPRLRSLSDVKGRALMIHQGGDNHSDHPAALGGGGARMYCGVI